MKKKDEEELPVHRWEGEEGGWRRGCGRQNSPQSRMQRSPTQTEDETIILKIYIYLVSYM